MWWHEPTAHTPDGEGFWVLSRFADILAVAGDAERFTSDGSAVRPSGGGGTLIEDLAGGFAAGVLLNMRDDARHHQMRRVALPFVSARSLAGFEPELRERAATIVEAAVAAGRCDLLVDVAAELPLQAIARLMGIPQQDRHALFGWANVTLDHDDHDLGETTDRQVAASAEMFTYGTALIEEKRACPAHDLISAMANTTVAGEPGEEPGPLDDLTVQMFFNLLIAAGSETTRNSIAGGALAFAEHPDQWQALRADRALLPSAVEEVLRYTSSTAYNRRTALFDTEIGGVPIRRGEKVTLWWSSADHDEAVFADPHRFDVRRFSSPEVGGPAGGIGRHLAFGQGPHFCLGANLARLEISVVLEALLDRVERIELAGPPEWTRSNKHTGLRHLPVELVAD